MPLCFLNNEVTEPWPQTKTEEILKSKSTFLKASCHLLLNQRVRITLFWKTSLVLIAFYVHISLQFTLVEHCYMAAVGFGWARLLLCLLMPCGLLLSSVITDNIPSFLITLHLVSGHYSFFSFTWATCISFVSVYQLFAELKQHNLLTFGLWHYKGQLSEMTRPHEWYSMKEKVLDHHSRGSQFKFLHRSYWLLQAKVACKSCNKKNTFWTDFLIKYHCEEHFNFRRSEYCYLMYSY